MPGFKTQSSALRARYATGKKNVPKGYHITRQASVRWEKKKRRRKKNLPRKIGNTQIKTPLLSTLDSPLPCSTSAPPQLSELKLLICCIIQQRFIYPFLGCFRGFFFLNLCQEWLCFNINETCPLTKTSSLAVASCTGLEKKKKEKKKIERVVTVSLMHACLQSPTARWGDCTD